MANYKSKYFQRSGTVEVPTVLPAAPSGSGTYKSDYFKSGRGQQTADGGALAPMAIRSFGNGAQEARQNGAELQEAQTRLCLTERF